MSLFIRTDVTAVRFYNNFILAGIGSSLEIYKRDSSKLIKRINVLKGQKIYGIERHCKSKFLILIFGGKQFSVIELLFQSDEDNIVLDRRLFCPIVCNDWLHCGVWITEEKVALLTAHNVVQIWNIENESLDNEYISKDNSILYSGHLLPLQDDFLVLSGTVFSEVIIRTCVDDVPIHHLSGHKGVIFSIKYNSEKGIIVTTSDDRSVRIWNIVNMTISSHVTKDYWINATITCVHNLYSHAARVMDSHITKDLIISIGEDSRICIWNHQGESLKYLVSHQNASIWSLDADDEYIVTGGGDSGVMLHPLSMLSQDGLTEILPQNVGSPRRLIFTARHNIVILDESNSLTYYDLSTQTGHKYNVNLTSTHSFLSVSSCKQLIAVADSNGKIDVFLETCKGDAAISKIIDTKLNLGKILSMQWAGNRHVVVCSETGQITVLSWKEGQIEAVQDFTLPPSKENWLTSSALSENQNTLIVSDRSGRTHVYFRGGKNPVKTFDRTYSRYGATSITIKHNEFMTTGRNGKVNYFSLSDNVAKIKYTGCKQVEFQWVEKFLDKNGKYLCGFMESTFVIYDVKNNLKVLELVCGGGHRSWDAVRYIERIGDKYEEVVHMVFLRNGSVHSQKFQLSKVMSRAVVDGIHSKQINCLKTYQCGDDDTQTFLISGGEDTTLRIASLNQTLKLKDEVAFKHLSSVRTLKLLQLNDTKIILVSAGGRAQITAKIISFNKGDSINVETQELFNYLIKGTDKERKGTKNWRDCSIDFDPETRIMDLEIIQTDNTFTIILACSDAKLRVISTSLDGEVNQLQELTYHRVCILKTHVFKFKDTTILVTCTTRGHISFWKINESPEILSNEPIISINTNKSGINAVDVKVIDDTKFLLATAGDDNAIHLRLIKMKNNLSSMECTSSWSNDSCHCSQITGLKLMGDLMVTTGVDQRVTLHTVSVTDGVKCEYYSQHYSDVADVHGLDILENSDVSMKVCVFGKGIEVLKIMKPVR